LHPLQGRGSLIDYTKSRLPCYPFPVAQDYPALGAKPIGGSLTLFIEVEGIEEVLAAVQKHGTKITMPLKEQFYGMREFAFEDPEGWVITVAERIAQ
jgi:uncharacterized glyoxalase superfamily protein PhnB